MNTNEYEWRIGCGLSRVPRTLRLPLGFDNARAAVLLHLLGLAVAQAERTAPARGLAGSHISVLVAMVNSLTRTQIEGLA